MRPTYENIEDLYNEKKLMRQFTALYPGQIQKTCPKKQLDYAVSNHGTVNCFVECKCRNNVADKYDEYMISLYKVQKALSLAQFTKALLLVGWVDKWGWWEFAKHAEHNCRVGWGGRDDRRDSLDKEPCLYIPTEFFHIRDYNRDLELPNNVA